MLLLILLVFIFWVALPGLLTGWMLREHGRSFLWGLLPGALLGPAGILATLAYIFLSGRGAQARRPSMHSRRFRPFYNVPFVGRLHVSTAWSLAGVAAFLCAWMVGGISYEFYTARLRRAETGRGPSARAGANQAPQAAAVGVTPNQLRATSKAAANAASSSATAAQTGGPLLSGLAGQPPQGSQTSGRPENSPAQGAAPLSDAGAALAQGLRPPDASPASEAPPAATSSPTSERAPATSTASAVSEVTRSLSSEGHRVHVAVSGDAQTATLSVSGPTLTRQAGNQLVGRSRHVLKASGIRIVVMINGRESWTYIL